MDAGKFSNSDNLIDIKFGNADIKSIKGAVVNLKYSQMDLGYAGSLRLDSKYSNLNADKIISLVMNFEGGKLDMKNGSVIDGKSKFSDLNISRLEQILSLDIQYGNCDVEEMPADFTSISVKNKYGTVDIGLPSGANYTLDAELKFCDLDFPESKANISQRIITNTSKSYQAYVGKEGTPSSKVFIRSEYGNVSLE
jgi:predicted membrane protein